MHSEIEQCAERLKHVLEKGGTIYTMGNGGSACEAMHLTEELVARYKKERPGFKSVHFHDAGTLTCWANDYDYQTAFARQVETFVSANDALIAFSTSGNSANIVNALESAKKTKALCIGFLGKDGGKAKDLCDLSLIVPHAETARIQEAHLLFLHCICEHLEASF